MFNEMQDNLQRLDTMLKTMKKRGQEYAQAEMDYKIALRTEILKLRDEGQPVTIVKDLCYGTKEVARKRMERDIAEANYRVIQEAIQTHKLKVRIIENQLDREFRS